MGIYNPNIPRILGQEWVPIRDETITYSQAVNDLERGHGFSVGTNTTLTEAKFYINRFPQSLTLDQMWNASIYKAGTEASSGPIRRVLIPCNNGGITGSGLTFQGGVSTVADALNDPSDDKYIEWATGLGVQGDLNMFFAFDQYSQLLMGKRILAVNFIYSAEVIPTVTDVEVGMNSSLGEDAQFNRWIYPDPFSSGDFFASHEFKDAQYNTIKIGDTNMFFSPTTTMNETIPWTYPQLQRFEASAASRIFFHIRSLSQSGTGAVFAMRYAAMEVFFCEEQRVSYGTLILNSIATVERFFIMNQNGITMRDLNGGTSPVLTPGDYYLTLAQGNTGDLSLGDFAVGNQPDLNAIRQLYPMAAHPGVEIRIPQPLTEGDVFTTQEVDVLPHLSLHTSAGVMTEVHVYGRQAVAQVWGTVTATQEIYDAGLTAAFYPQVRFYARRFGNTVVPLKLTHSTLTTISTSITPSVFDDLDEIVDGWKEVTLNFITPPTMGTGTNPQWNFSAAGELAGNRWEVLGAAAPAISGVTSNMLQLAAPSNQLYAATYGAPVSGAPINLGWISGISPLVSATTDDQASDGVLIFSQDMPTVTGMTVQVLNQAVSGIGQECGVNPIFIPSQIQYNSLSWPAQQAFVVNDDFSRVSAAGWGTATSGQLWTENGGVGADYTVDGSSGVITLNAAGSSRHTSILTNTFLDIDGYGQISMTTTPSGAMTWGALTWHKESATNDMYQAEVDFMTDGSVALALRKWVASVDTVLATITIGYEYVLGTKFNVRVEQRGIAIRARAWLDGTDEPGYWQLQVADPDLATAAGVGTRSRADAGSTTPQVVLYDNIMFSDPTFGALELQRMDEVDTGWQTIMKATNPAVSGFNDFEARVGLSSSYRIRMTNVLNFAGPWSSTITSTIPAPGVTGSQIVTDSQILIFTSNEHQDGSINLAYANAWEGSVNEGFTFPESAFVQLQAMYNKDFFTAFRPRERGGSRFSRTVLVQAAAISPPSLPDFTSLRDMAWDDVPYICVRDNDGNRWLATVLVPTGNVRHFRKLYMAEVDVIEVTDTPSPVNP